MELTVDPADFTRLAEYNVLVVNGCSHPNHNRDSGVVLNVAPSDLLALVGQACAWCGGEGKLYCDGCGGHLCPEPICQDPDCPDPHWCPDECDGTTPVCHDCHGTGSELLTVTTSCGCECHGYSRPYPDMHDNGCPRCTNGTRSLLVCLTGPPVQVVGEHYYTPNTHAVEVTDQGLTFLHHADDGAMQMKRIDLGPNTASLIGRWVWLPDALEVVG